MKNNDQLASNLLSLVIAAADNNVLQMRGLLNSHRESFAEAVAEKGKSMQDFYTLLLNKAVEHNAADAVRFLADQGADVNAKAAQEGVGTLLDLAHKSLAMNAANALIEKGADAKAAKPAPTTPQAGFVIPQNRRKFGL